MEEQALDAAGKQQREQRDDDECSEELQHGPAPRWRRSSIRPAARRAGGAGGPARPIDRSAPRTSRAGGA
jgi:hypothetical protein